MGRAIVLPLYDHTTDEEIRELLEAIRGIGVDDAILVHGYVPPEPELERRDDPCDCGTVVAALGGYVDHAPGGHPDCTAASVVLDVALEELELEFSLVPTVLVPFGVRFPRFRVERDPVERFRDDAERTRFERAFELLELGTRPIAGRPGWRADAEGREWYSSAWLSA